MTSKPVSRTPATQPAGQFPEFSPRDDMQNPIYLHRPGHLAALDRHFGAPDTTVILGEVPVGWNVDRASVIARQGLRH